MFADMGSLQKQSERRHCFELADLSKEQQLQVCFNSDKHWPPQKAPQTSQPYDTAS